MDINIQSDINTTSTQNKKAIIANKPARNAKQFALLWSYRDNGPLVIPLRKIFKKYRIINEVFTWNKNKVKLMAISGKYNLSFSHFTLLFNHNLTVP